MARNLDFQRELEAAMGRKKLNQAEVVRRTGISQGWIHSMVRNGKVPSRETLLQLVSGLELDTAERARLFTAAGYSDVEVLASSLELSPAAVEIARGADRLSPDDQELVRRLIDDPQRLHGIRLLITTSGGRVMTGAGVSSALCPSA
jgi:transcriptional regulator with XRE-family HTH domain